MVVAGCCTCILHASTRCVKMHCNSTIRCHKLFLVQLPYNWVMWYFRVTLNALTIFGNAIAMLALFSLSLTGWGAAIAKQVRSCSSVLVAWLYLRAYRMQIGDEALTSFWVAFTTGLLYAGTPFVLSYMHSPAALQSLSATFAVYYVFIPSIVSDFLTYSLCRLDDWSWGNKDKMTAGSKVCHLNFN